MVRVSVAQKEINPPHRQDPQEQPKTDIKLTKKMTPPYTDPRLAIQTYHVTLDFDLRLIPNHNRFS